MSESIYNLIQEDYEEPAQPARHKSKYPGTLKPTASTFCAPLGVTNVGGIYKGGINTKEPNFNFGPQNPKEHVPSKFLKSSKTQADCLQAEIKPFVRKNPVPSKPLVPRVADMPPKKPPSDKDFIMDNAITNILSAPPKGKVKPEKTGLEKHDEYGKVPAYLKGIKERIQVEYDMIREIEQHGRRPESLTVMPEEERLALIQALKNKWAEVNRGYQSMTHLIHVDTISKVRRKEKYEKQLEELEKNIAKLSKKLVLIKQ